MTHLPRLAAVSCTSCLLVLLASCSSSTPSSSSVQLSPGDHFYDSVAAMTGGGAASSFRLAVALFDPKYASSHPAGTPGSNASIQEAAGTLITSGGSVSVDGTWSNDGTVSVQGSGWSLQGKVGTNVLTGTFAGPTGAGLFAGADTSQGTASVYIGTEQGDAFDVVVLVPGGPVAASAGDAGADAGSPKTGGGSGIVTGVLGGSAGGTIAGTYSGGSISYTWQGSGGSGSGTGSVASGGLGGSSQPQGCTAPASTWICQSSSYGYIDGTECGCIPSSSPLASSATGATTSSCPGTWDCCIAYTVNNEAGPWCQCYQGTTEMASVCSTAGQTNGENGASVASCPSGPAPAGSGGTSSCAQPWQAAPAPCAPSVSGACLTWDYAQDPDPSSGSCPPAGGCTNFGAYSACCIS